MKDAHGVKFLGKMGLATIASTVLGFVGVVWVGPLALALILVGYLWVTGDSPWGADDNYLPSAYHLAVTKAVLLKEDQWWAAASFPSTEGYAPLCNPAQIQKGRLRAGQSARIPCAVAAGEWDRHLCGRRQQEVCAVVDIDPATYDDPEIHARIVRALSSPCDFFAPAASEYQKHRIALGCDTGGTARRRVVIRAGARKDILEFHAEEKSRR